MLMQKSIEQTSDMGVKKEQLMGRITFIYSIVLSVITVLTAIAFAASCIHIFKTGGASPFTREVISMHLGRVLPLNILCLIGIIGGGVLSLISDARQKPHVQKLTSKTLLRIYEKRLSPYSRSEKYVSACEGEKKVRRYIVISCIAIAAILVAAAAVFVFDFPRYTKEDCNTDIAYSVVISAVCAVCTGAACYAASVLLERSYARSVASAKSELSEKKSSDEVPDEDKARAAALSENAGHAVYIARGAVIVIAIALIIAGVSNGGMADVLGKAVQICTECIGLG